ncbi:MAG TPA: 2-C-methyl-D-erythritol 4-phosphate cytidylyltransferase [Gemmatimonadales bacterium]|nr:2-C-methyl-D-erythritol 4-phosphate cytidylyltransferase [Gemmatimonadales bacterium]
MPPDVGVIIVAAGRGARIGGTPKQFRDLVGVPVLLRALRPFTSHPAVACTVVALPEADAAAPPEWLAPLVGDGLRLVAGGSERGDSVRSALAALPAHCATVLVHDGARPLVSRETIDAVIAAAATGVGAVAAVPLGDTLKAVEEGSSSLVVERTIPRQRLWRAQTPQGFPRALLERALNAAAADAVQGTDDAELVERIGGRVEIVPDQQANIKLTTPGDFALAEALLRTVS